MEQELKTKRKEAVRFFLDKNIFLSPEFVCKIEPGFNNEEFYKYAISKINDRNFLLLDSDIVEAMNNKENLDLNWLDIERSKVLYEKDINKKTYMQFLDSFRKDFPKKEDKTGAKPAKSNGCDIHEKKIDSGINITSTYEDEPKKRGVQDFVAYFNVRYHSIRRILSNRQELQDATSINKLYGKKERSSISIIGFVIDKATTKNKNYILTLEDPSGTIKVLINKNKPELYNLAKEIILDDIIGINGVNGDNIIFANNIMLPEVPLSKEMKRAKEECYAVFLSDIHTGSNNFLPEKFDRFLKWIRKESGSEKQKEVASKVKYIFITGDLVDGIGIYPNQDKELDIKDIYKQYEECAKLLKQIPLNINIIMCPGNHDAMRIAEPQPAFYKDFAEALWNIPNATMVSNPAMINIHSSEDFPGFDVLMYHGYSFDFYVSNVDAIREQGGYDRADLIMKFLLQRRHLAPTHKSTLYIPDNKRDPLVIEKIPDFFITGHIHKAAAANYRNVTMVCGSCWQSKTSFQEKVGHNPEPARVPIVNLQTRQVKILRF